MRPTLFAVSLSLALSLPFAAHAAGERGRGPILTTARDANEHLVTRTGRIRTGVVLAPTGKVVGTGSSAQPELEVTSVGKLQAESFAGKVAAGQRFFGPVMAGKQDPVREWVLKRGRTAKGHGYVAFLSGTDPRHPMTQARLQDARDTAGDSIDEDTAEGMLADHGFEGSRVPFGQRTHILVVPTTPRAHIAQNYVGQIERGDYELMLDLMDTADSLGRELGLSSPKVFQNTATMTSIGQTHIHLVGGLTNPGLLKDIEPPTGGRPALLTMDRGKVVEMGSNGLPRGGR